MNPNALCIVQEAGRPIGPGNQALIKPAMGGLRAPAENWMSKSNVKLMTARLAVFCSAQGD